MKDKNIKVQIVNTQLLDVRKSMLELVKRISFIRKIEGCIQIGDGADDFSCKNGIFSGCDYNGEDITEEKMTLSRLGVLLHTVGVEQKLWPDD